MLCEAKQSHPLSSPCSCHTTLSLSVWTHLLGSCCSFLFVVVVVSSFICCISAKALSALWIRDLNCLEELSSMKPWCCLSYHSINTNCTGLKFFRIIWCIWHGPDSVKDACGHPVRDVAGAEVLSRTWRSQAPFSSHPNAQHLVGHDVAGSDISRLKLPCILQATCLSILVPSSKYSQNLYCIGPEMTRNLTPATFPPHSSGTNGSRPAGRQTHLPSPWSY